MPKKFLKRHLPDFHRLRSRRGMGVFGRLLDDPFLLHLNRRSVAGGLAVGVFFAFVPLPLQMLYAVAAAVALRVNLVIAMTAVWITNPLTIPPLFWFCYRIGTWMMGGSLGASQEFSPTLEWFWAEIEVIWRPLLLGSLTVGTVLALASYGGVHLLWRLHIVRALRRRRERRLARSDNS